MNELKLQEEKRLYVLVRNDLTMSQRGVQAGHAVAEYLMKETQHDWKNGTLIYLGVKGEQELVEWMNKLELENIPYRLFREPDRNNEITAFACICSNGIFKGLKPI